MRKILIFNSGSYLYGAEKGLINLISILSINFEIICVIPSPGPLEKKLKDLKVKIIYFPLPILKFSFFFFYYLNYFFLSLICFFYFSLYIITKKIDIILTNNLLIIFPSLVAKITSRKHIWYVREFFSTSRINLFLRRFILKFSHLIIAQSQAIKEKLSLDKKTYIIYEPLNEKNYTIYDKFLMRKKFNLPLQAIILTIISRIHPTKGQFEFLKRIRNLLEYKKNLIILIVGDITPPTRRNKIYKKKIENFIKKNKIKNVYLLGFQEDIDKFLSLSDICIFPFLREEPFGIAVLESLAFNKITLFPKKGGLKEIAYIFKNRNIFDVNEIEKILSTLNSPLKSEKNNLFIPEEFSFSTYRNKILSLFSKL